MEQNVRHAVVGDDEAEALGDIEPFDAAADLNELERPLLDRSACVRLVATVIEGGIRPPAA